MPTAEAALRKAPGVLAVKIDYESGKATVGSTIGTQAPVDEIMRQLESLGYQGKILKKQ